MTVPMMPFALTRELGLYFGRVARYSLRIARSRGLSRPSFPLSPEELSAGYVERALRTAGVLRACDHVRGIDVIPLSEVAFTSRLYRVRIDYTAPVKGAPATLIAKMVPAWTFGQQVDAAITCQSLREHWCMTHDLAVRVPRCYRSEIGAAGEWLHLMEDVVGMKSGDHLAVLSAQRARRLLTEIAALHARFWGATDGLVPDEFSGLKEYRTLLDTSAIACWKLGVRDGAATTAPKGGPPPDLGALIERMCEPPVTLLHGDLRSSNAMWSADGESVCVIDWAALSVGRGVFDVAYLLGTAMDAETRGREESWLVAHYHSELERRGVRGYSLSECVADYHVFLRLTALVYTLPAAYNRAIITEQLVDEVRKCREVGGRNLQPILAVPR
jgi:hypothetical protein